MNSKDDAIDRELALLGERTQGLRARPGFSARVMERVASEPRSLLLELGKPARRLLPVALLAAAFSIVWAVSANQSANQAMALSYDSTELDW